jgi:putative phage-type endonuclease
MTLTATQIAERAHGLGASEIGAIVGVNDFATIHDVWLTKLGLADFVENDAVRMGNYFEPVIAQMYADQSGDVLAKCEWTCIGKEAWMLATPDYVNFTMGCLVEVKHVGFRQMHKWGTEADGIPYSYLVQCQWQMHVTGARNVIVIAVLGGVEFRKYVVSYDAALAKTLEDAARAFWTNNVLTRTPPAVDGSEGAKRMLKALYPRSERRVVQADAKTEEWMRKLAEAEVAIDAAEASKLEAQNMIKDLVRDADEVIGAGFKASWRTSKDGKRPFKFDATKSSKKAA